MKGLIKFMSSKEASFFESCLLSSYAFSVYPVSTRHNFYIVEYNFTSIYWSLLYIKMYIFILTHKKYKGVPSDWGGRRRTLFHSIITSQLIMICMTEDDKSIQSLISQVHISYSFELWALFRLARGHSLIIFAFAQKFSYWVCALETSMYICQWQMSFILCGGTIWTPFCQKESWDSNHKQF